MIIKPVKKIRGEFDVPGDKSISHRAVMFSSLAEGLSEVRNFLRADDCESTVNAFRAMGVDIEFLDNDHLKINGAGLQGLKAPLGDLYLGNSGTTLRLLMGILSGQRFSSRLTGDDSLSRRPMRRVTAPLRKMGAKIEGPEDANHCPLEITGGDLRGIDFTNEIPSAQVKSAVLLAGLYADGETTVREPLLSRDHTEKMLKMCGADFIKDGSVSRIRKTGKLKPMNIDVPGDISSAAFLIIAALLAEESDVVLKNVGINPTRTGILDVVQKMGAKIEILNRRKSGEEPVADLRVMSAKLNGFEINEEDIPFLIDEIPVLMVAASVANGKSVIRGAKELRVKETDRIKSMAENLSKIGADVRELEDGCVIEGVDKLNGGKVKSYGDHRTAMSMIVAGLISAEGTDLDDVNCVNVSFPGFLDIVTRIS